MATGFFNHPLVKIFFAVVFTFLIIFFILFLAVFFLGKASDISVSTPENSIGVIEVSGLIRKSETVVKNLQKFAKDKNIKAIVLKLNSPGGGVVPSREIYSEVLKIKKKKKVYAYLQSVAASGAYYIACACDKVIANPGTITGSIGVILEFTNFRQLFDKLGIKAIVIKSGKFKDVGNPFRPITDEEKELLNNVVLNIYNQFLRAVSENRHIKIEELKKIADGRVFSGEQALGYKLVDSLGSFTDVIDMIKKDCKIKGEPELVFPVRKRNFIEKILEDSEKTFIDFLEKSLIKVSYTTG
jgi:protease-4